MKFSLNWLKDFVDVKVVVLPAGRQAEKLAELLNLHFAETAVEKKGKDYIFDISILPNRAHDALSHIVVAREISAILNTKYLPALPIGQAGARHGKTQNTKFKEDKKIKTADYLDLKVEDSKLCPRYIGRIIDGVKVGPSPKWLKERIESVGLRSINNIVDATNYVMLEIGQPLHVFDFDKLDNSLKIKYQKLKSQPKIKNFKKEIIVRRAKKDEKITTLDGENYILDESVLVIADAKEPIAIAGIKGGKKAEIDLKTKRIVVEAANFDAVAIRRASKKLNLATDASYRFGYGLSKELPKIAEERVVFLIQKIAGGKIFKGHAYRQAGVKDFYPKKESKKIISLDLNWLEKFLGVKIPASEIKIILENLDFKIKKSAKDRILVEAPVLRLDIQESYDLAEEIGRIYGYENIFEIFPNAALISPKENEDLEWQKKAEKILTGLGLTQNLSYSFYTLTENKLKEIGEDPKKLLRVENPTSPDRTWLRGSLILNLLDAVSKNLNNFDEVRLFEIGKVYKPDGEKMMLSGILVSKKDSIQRREFFEMKGIIDAFLESFGIEDIWYDSAIPTSYASNQSLWHSRRIAEIKIGTADKKSEKITEHSEEIGYLGEINPKILEKFDITERVAVFDIDFEKLQKLAQKERYYEPFSRFPAVRRDLAVLVPNNTRVEDVLYLIETAGGGLLYDTDIFDIYEGPELPEGKINFAFRLIFQSFEKTLTAEEVEEKIDKIIKSFEENPDWEIRK